MGGLVIFGPPIYHVWRYAFNVVARSSIIKVLYGDRSLDLHLKTGTARVLSRQQEGEYSGRDFEGNRIWKLRILVRN